MELPQDILDGGWISNWRLDDGRRSWLDRSLPVRYWPMTKARATEQIQNPELSTVSLTVFFPAAYKQN